MAWPWWAYVLVTLGLTHVTIAAVTIFLHRYEAHRALDLHPLSAHFFRLWLWLTTGMGTLEWTSIHRKHHARCETPEDPHSPQQLMKQSSALRTACAMREELVTLWSHSSASSEQLVKELQDWCQRVERSGVRQLQELSLRLRSYSLN